MIHDPADEDASSKTAEIFVVSRNTQAAAPMHLGFGVQFILENPNCSIEQIRQAITAMGKCLWVEGDEEQVRVHVHVLDPGVPLSFAVQVGFITEIVINNIVIDPLDGGLAQSAEDEQESNGQATAFALDGSDPAESDRQGLADEEAAAPAPYPTLMAPPSVEAAGLIAVAPDAGFAEIFRKLGVSTVVTGGFPGINPSAGELAEAIGNLPNHWVIVLPNNGNVLGSAQQAAQLLEQEGDLREVVIVPSKTAPQGIAAALAFDSSAEDILKLAAHMQERMGVVDTGEVTQAVSAAQFDGVTVEVGDFIGLHDGRLVTCSHNLTDVVLSLLIQMAADESGLITLYYGDFISPDAAENLIEIVRTHYPEQDVELAYGGQSQCHYVLSTE